MREPLGRVEEPNPSSSFGFVFNFPEERKLGSLGIQFHRNRVLTRKTTVTDASFEFVFSGIPKTL